MSKVNTRTVACPTCQQSVEWSEKSDHRPFCSKRCKLIDFGEWATEKHNIPGDPLYPSDEDDPELLQ